MSLRSFLSSFRTALPAAVPKKPPVAFSRAAGLGVGTLRSAALSRDGDCVAVATSRGVAVYGRDRDADTWTQRWFRPTESWAISVTLSGDGRRVAGSTSAGRATVWDIASGDELCSVAGEGKTYVALDGDGGRVAVGDTAGVSVWSVDSGARELTLEGTSQEITAVAFHPAEPRVAAADYSGHALMWDADSGREMRRWECARPLRDIAFSADGAHIAAVGKDWTLWDVDTGIQVHSATAPGPMISVAFSADGNKLVTGTSRNRALIWDLVTGARAQDMAPHLSEVHSVAYGPDDRFLLMASQKLQEVDPHSGAPVGVLPCFARLMHACASPDGERVALADKQVITVWDRRTGRSVAVLDGHTHTISGVRFRARGAQIISHTPREIICWDARSGDKQYVIDGLSSVGGASLSRDGALLAAAIEERGTYTLGLWDAASGERIEHIASVPRRGMGIHELALSPDATLLAVRSSTKVTVWDVAGRSERFRVDPVVGRAGALVWSPDGKTLATAMQSGEVLLWQTSGRKRRILSGADGGATGLVYSADGSLLAGRFKARPADQVLVWDAAAGKRVHGPLTGGPICQALAFRHDNSTLVAGFSGTDESGMWVAWHMATGEEIARHGDEATWAAAFSEDGTLLITGTGDGVAALWDVSG